MGEGVVPLTDGGDKHDTARDSTRSGTTPGEGGDGADTGTDTTGPVLTHSPPTSPREVVDETGQGGDNGGDNTEVSRNSTCPSKNPYDVFAICSPLVRVNIFSISNFFHEGYFNV